MALSPMTPEQLDEMRAKAAEARRAKAAALGEVKNGTLPITSALSGEDARLRKAKVRRVLLALPGVGDVRAASLMKAAGIHDTRLVKGLTPRQRNDLVALLPVA